MKRRTCGGEVRKDIAETSAVTGQLRSSQLGYVIISPVRDEGAYIKLTLDSVVSQSVRPTQWIIVNDGSTDNTASVVGQYVKQYPWIKLITLDKQGERQRGARVVQVFYEGYRRLDVAYDFLVKLDGDMSFDADYFECLLNQFAGDPQLGICSGEPCYPYGQKWRPETAPPDHTRGQTKVYRRTCFENIGGLVAVLGWDSIDEFRAQMKGWKTRTFPELRLRHHRPMGSAEGSLQGIAKRGEVAYFLGYPWRAIIARSLFRCFVDRPLFFVGMSTFLGYLNSWLRRKPHFEDAELLAYVRRKQLRRLAFWHRAP
jgi:biofilm PGA synthesis N-glycosyltransferase PgaC